MLPICACKTLSAAPGWLKLGDKPVEKGLKGVLQEDLAEFLPKGGRSRVLVAADLDQALQAGLELILVCARGTPLEVQLQLQNLGVVQLPVDVPVQLRLTIVAVHGWGT